MYDNSIIETWVSIDLLNQIKINQVNPLINEESYQKSIMPRQSQKLKATLWQGDYPFGTVVLWVYSY